MHGQKLDIYSENCDTCNELSCEKICIYERELLWDSLSEGVHGATNKNTEVIWNAILMYTSWITSQWFDINHYGQTKHEVRLIITYVHYIFGHIMINHSTTLCMTIQNVNTKFSQ